jgi:asparagine synthase (glutamine-hydrolysing)
MCGIVGQYNFGDRRPVEDEVLRRMCQVIEHRGPDDEGYFRDGDFGMGMRRLSIIDLPGGSQPIFNEDGTVAVVFNGEIYNYRDLMAQLKSKGHRFRTRSDTETIVHLYEEMGPTCPRLMRGMFAFALWDGPNRRLLLARDRVGKKPLFYWLGPGRCVFASEIKSILQDPQVPREMNLRAAVDYVTFLCVPWPKTIYEDIWKLPPGSVAVVSPQGLRLSQYWDLDFSAAAEARGDERQVTGELMEQLRDSVGCRLESEVPLGAFLSGGIDSSSVVALMSSLQERPVISVSIGFQEKKFDEQPQAEGIARRFRTRHHTHVVRPEALSVLDKLVWHFDEPFADSSAVPTYYVCRAARQHVTVALSGDGGDEAFGGYRRYYFDLLEGRLRAALPEFVRRFLISPLAAIYPKADRLPRFLRAKTLLSNVAATDSRGYFHSRSIFQEPMRRCLLRPEVLKAVGRYDPFSVLEPHFQRTQGWPHLSRLQYVDLKTYLPDDILVKVDRMSMANSLEVRSPLLDQRLWAYLAGVSPDLKVNGRERKYILKKTMEPLLPRATLYRKKRGFVVPLARWFRDSISQMGRQILLDDGQAGSGLFDPVCLERLWRDHQSGRRNYATHLWTILMFELWYRTFMKTSPVRASSSSAGRR